MGKRGPKPTPTAVLKLRGSWRADARQGEPQAIGGIPEMPSWLSDGGKEVWGQIVADLGRIPGLLAVVDRNALARYCETWVQWRQAMEVVADDGRTIEGSRGTVPNPEVAIAQKFAVQLEKLEHDFGMNPAARAGITVSPKSKRDDDDKRDKGRFFRPG